jgi:Regulator of G protein signaling domain
MIIKEAFMVFYFCIIIALVLGNLGIEYQLEYVLRSAFISVGSTAFCLRLMINRCAKHWFPEWMMKYFKQIAQVINPSRSQKSISSQLMSGQESEARSDASNTKAEADPMYRVSSISGDDIASMLAAITDPDRSRIFKEVALKCHVLENVNFIEDVIKFTDEDSVEMVMRSTASANDTMLSRARELFDKYVRAGSEEEVNVSSKARAAIETSLNSWAALQEPFPLSHQHAKLCLVDDLHVNIRAQVFHVAFKEISLMLYQNMWTKFRIAETQAAAEDEELGRTPRTPRSPGKPASRKSSVVAALSRKPSVAAGRHKSVSVTSDDAIAIKNADPSAKSSLDTSLNI